MLPYHPLHFTPKSLAVVLNRAGLDVIAVKVVRKCPKWVAAYATSSVSGTASGYSSSGCCYSPCKSVSDW